MFDLDALFETLEQPIQSTSSNERFSAHIIPGFENHRLAKDQDGSPVLLIGTSNIPGVRFFTPIRLEHLHITHSVECNITNQDGEQESTEFSVIRCVGDDKALRKYFLRIIEGILLILGSTPSQEDVSRAIGNLVELFRVMAEPSRKAVQGFWAELFLIAEARDSIRLIRAWHTQPEDVYDFNEGYQRIEVKSVSGRERHHHFSLAQLQPPAGANVVVVSVLMERSGNGTALSELIEEIRLKLTSERELLMRFDQIVAATLGETWKRAFTARFDRELARSSLRFYPASEIPSPEIRLPESVYDVHFRSSLANAKSMSRQEIRTIGGLVFAAT